MTIFYVNFIITDHQVLLAPVPLHHHQHHLHQIAVNQKGRREESARKKIPKSPRNRRNLIKSVRRVGNNRDKKCILHIKDK